jgi:glycosyltransferase involved in cell wall biosynthesis
VSPLKRVAFIGSHLPRRCGIATFTHDLHRAVASGQPDLATSVIAMTDRCRSYSYPPAVGFQIRDDLADDYVRAASWLNKSGYEVVSLQHEYGIFGGAGGANIIELLSRLEMPIVTTLHTVLAEPSCEQRPVLDRIIGMSSKLVVMSEKGHGFLRSVHKVPARKIEIIPHGVPDFPFLEPQGAKDKLGFGDRATILTFGLLSPSKGIETVIDAMPGIVKSCPDALYVVLGATHPHLVRDEGEAYRERLIRRVQELGMENHVVFVDQFVDQATLLDFISMCDVYVTPYLNEAQMTSGTLAYSFGLGKAVVSTPYWHAQELLADGRGILVPFGSVKPMGEAIASLLTDSSHRLALRERAYTDSRSMTWSETGKRYLSTFEAARTVAQLAAVAPIYRSAARERPRSLPDVRIGHFLDMCDDTGMLQHAVHSVADRGHGYCVDDNARALLLSCALARTDEVALPANLTARFAAFIQHAWNPDNSRFRNFMSFDRRWLEPLGSEDSHGRTLWALAECARHDGDPARRRWAVELFSKALPIVETFSSPRAWAFTLLGLDSYCALGVCDQGAVRLRTVLADRLVDALSASEREGWVWFESVLAYDNARLPQALIETGSMLQRPAYVEAGLRSLRWLMGQQTAPAGWFRPVGSNSFGHVRQTPELFDQQPLEATATISACLAAGRADRSGNWPAAALKAFDWFLGENDLAVALADPVSGGCSDGLHPDRRNENMGAESVLSYLLGLVEVRAELRATTLQGKLIASIPRNGADAIVAQRRSSPGGPIVSIQIPESSQFALAPGPRAGGRAAFQASD